jgi:N-acetyl sugar amidotransferase
MRYCRRCVYPENHPFGLGFDEDGVCLGCRVHEEKDRLDWVEREQALRRLLDDHRDRSPSGYDCVVPVSGGRDSFFILHLVRKVYGLNPLLVSYNRHYNTAAGLRNLELLRTLLGADIITQTLDPRFIARLCRTTLRRLGSMHWHYLAGNSVFPVQIAVRMRIPLIIWGHHQGLDQTGMFSHRDEVEMSRRYRRDHDLMGFEAEDLTDVDGLSEKDLQPFFYPSDAQLWRHNVRGVYLGNYIRWDTKAQHEKMLDIYDYYAGPVSGTFDTYSDVDCLHYGGLHDYLKILRHGYGKATDHACREIRFGRMSREEGAAHARGNLKDAMPSDAAAFAERLGIATDELTELVEAQRNPHLWLKTPAGWRLRQDVGDDAGDDAGDGVETARLPRRESAPFRRNRPRTCPEQPQEPQLLTQGWCIP